MTCISPRVCTSCDTSQFRKYDPVSGLCACFDGFYEDSKKRCVPCPSPCKTCKLVYLDYSPVDPKDPILVDPKDPKLVDPIGISLVDPNDIKYDSVSIEIPKEDLSLRVETESAEDPASLLPPWRIIQPSTKVVCLSCPCELHRVYNEKTQTCDCDQGYYPSKCEKGLCLPRF